MAGISPSSCSLEATLQILLCPREQKKPRKPPVPTHTASQNSSHTELPQSSAFTQPATNQRDQRNPESFGNTKQQEPTPGPPLASPSSALQSSAKAAAAPAAPFSGARASWSSPSHPAPSPPPVPPAAHPFPAQAAPNGAPYSAKPGGRAAPTLPSPRPPAESPAHSQNLVHAKSARCPCKSSLPFFFFPSPQAELLFGWLIEHPQEWSISLICAFLCIYFQEMRSSWFIKPGAFPDRGKQNSLITPCHLSDIFIIPDAAPIKYCLVPKAISVKLS